MPGAPDITIEKPPESIPVRLRTREEAALQEVGATAVSKPVSLVIVVAFLASLVSVAGIQHWHELSGSAPASSDSRLPGAYDIVFGLPGVVAAVAESKGSWWDRLMVGNHAMLQLIGRYETNLEEESVVSRSLLPRTQALLVRLGGGNEKSYVGRDGWLFYRPDIDYVTGPGFLDPAWIRHRAAGASGGEDAPSSDPLPAILGFKEQLAVRGIELIVVPAPSKATVHPSRFSTRIREDAAPVQNPSFDRFIRALGDAGVLVFDPAERLAGLHSRDARPQFLRTDTHWRPESMERIASELAVLVNRRIQFKDTDPAGFPTETVEVSGFGDIAAMLRLPKDQNTIDPEQVQVRQVMDAAGLWRPSRDSEVLLLGDSFSNIYSLAEMGWGEAAGFAEHLSLHLGRPVDAILRNDNGSFATREALVRDLRRGTDRLEGKKVVIWQFAARELAFGDWKQFSLELGEPPTPSFVVPPEGEVWDVSGAVEEVSRAPRPGSVPYKDHIVSVHLVSLQRADGVESGSDAVVYLTSMKDNVWTSAARLREGSTIRLKLRPWSEAAPDLERINRSELADVQLQFEEPCWGELIDG